MALAPVDKLNFIYFQARKTAGQIKQKAVDLTLDLSRSNITASKIAMTASVVQGIYLFCEERSYQSIQMSFGLIAAGALEPLANLAGKNAIFLKKVALLSFGAYNYHKGRFFIEFTTAFSYGWATIKAVQFLFKSERTIQTTPNLNLTASKIAKAILLYFGVFAMGLDVPSNSMGLGFGFTVAALHNRIAKLAGPKEIELKKAALIALLAHTFAKWPQFSVLSGGFFIGWSFIKAAEFIFERGEQNS